jgi:TIR domain
MSKLHKAEQAQQDTSYASRRAPSRAHPIRKAAPNRRRRDVFISYRRTDSMSATGRIYDALADRYGKAHVFKDVESLHGGDDFVRTIAETIACAAVVLVVIGQRWLDTRAEVAQRRLDNPADSVRREVEEALGTDGLAVVPVLVEGAHMPAASDLPEGMRRLPALNAVVVNDDPDFAAGMHRLIHEIDPLLPAGMWPQVRRWRWALGTLSGVTLLIVLAALLRPLAFSAPSPPPPYQGVSTSRDRLTDVIASPSGNAWAVGTRNDVNGNVSDSFILHHSQGSWVTVHTLSQPVALNSIAMISSTVGWAVGEQGTILHDSNGKWTNTVPVTDKALNSVAMEPTGEAWAVGADGTILHEVSDTWSLVASPTPDTLSGVALGSSGQVWAVGTGGTILHETGGTWTLAASPTTVDLVAVTVGPTDETWAVGADGIILREVAGVWTIVASPATADLLAVGVDTTGEVWAVGPGGTVLHYTGPGSWALINGSYTGS